MSALWHEGGRVWFDTIVLIVLLVLAFAIVIYFLFL
jgi:hypothetical protein